MKQFKFNLGHLGQLTFDRGLDEVLIEIESVKNIENRAAVEIVFVPIAGDYNRYINNVIIVEGLWRGILPYSTASRTGLMNNKEQTNEQGEQNGQVEP